MGAVRTDPGYCTQVLVQQSSVVTSLPSITRNLPTSNHGILPICASHPHGDLHRSCRPSLPSSCLHWRSRWCSSSCCCCSSSSSSSCSSPSCRSRHPCIHDQTCPPCPSSSCSPIPSFSPCP